MSRATMHEIKILVLLSTGVLHCDHCTSRLTVVSRAAKQSRTSDTTVCYIHERSILIERSLKACYKNLPYEKTTRVIRTTSYY